MTVIIKNAQVKNAHIGPAIPTNGLMSYWNAASTTSYPRSGTIWYDIVGNNNGSMINMTSGNFSEDVQGSFVFDGTDEYISVPTDESLNAGTGTFSMTAWIKPDTSSMSAGSAYIVANKRGIAPEGSGAGWSLSVTKNGISSQWGFFRVGVDDGSGNGPTSNGSTNHADSTWHHIAVSYNARRSQFANSIIFQTYVNSVSDLSYFVPSGIGSISNNVPLEIGATAYITGIPAGSVSDAFPGSISTVKFYKRDLSAGEVKQDYLASKSRFGL